MQEEALRARLAHKSEAFVRKQIEGLQKRSYCVPNGVRLHSEAVQANRRFATEGT